eukprot:scaffold8203_cov57-Attheya_sp.AAC.7
MFVTHNCAYKAQTSTVLATALQELERNESAPAGPKKAKIDDRKGRQSMKIDVDSILLHLRSLQDTPKLIHRVNHDDTERFIELEGRDKTVSDAVTLLKRRHEAYEKNTVDRTKFPFIVFSGMSGLGITPILEEGLDLLSQAGIREPYHTALVMYGNGTGPKPLDNRGVLFVAIDGERLSWLSRKFLPENAADLDLETALEVIAKAASQLDRARKVKKDAEEELLPPVPDSTLSLVIGVDGYQRIPWVPGPNSTISIEDRDKSFLWELLGAFQSCSSPLGSNEYWELFDCKRTTGFNAIVAPKRSGEGDSLCGQRFSFITRSETKNVLLGGIPRPSIQFAALKHSFDMVWAGVTRKWTEFSFADLVQLLAAAVSGRKFSREENTNIKDSTWGQLSDQGVCILEGDSGSIHVPYSVFRRTSFLSVPPEATKPQRCFSQNLKWMSRHTNSQFIFYSSVPRKSTGKNKREDDADVLPAKAPPPVKKKKIRDVCADTRVQRGKFVDLVGGKIRILTPADTDTVRYYGREGIEEIFDQLIGYDSSSSTYNDKFYNISLIGAPRSGKIHFGKWDNIDASQQGAYGRASEK